MATKILNIEQIGQEAYDGWPGKTGEERRKSVLELIAQELPVYAALTGFSEEEILTAWEKKRNVNCVNWYQKANYPDLGTVIVVESMMEFKLKFPSGIYICPNCNGETKNPYECESGKLVYLMNNAKKKEVCNWKVYGFFRDMGKGVRVIIKEKFLDHPVPEVIFKPIEYGK